MLSHSQRLLGQVQRWQTSVSRPGAAQLQANVTAALVADLQSLTAQLRFPQRSSQRSTQTVATFRSSQSDYCKQLQSREDNFQRFFGEAEDADLIGELVISRSQWE